MTSAIPQGIGGARRARASDLINSLRGKFCGRRHRPPVVGPAGSGERDVASIPDFSGVWASPVPSRIRTAGFGPWSGDEQIAAQRGEQLQTNWSATTPDFETVGGRVLKKYGELSLAGTTFPGPANQCWPEPAP